MNLVIPTKVPQSHVDLLTKRTLAHLATVHHDGSPHVTPMWFDWDGDEAMFSTIGTSQKALNVLRDPRVALCVLDPENPYRYLRIRGIAAIGADVGHRVITALFAKYLGSGMTHWDDPGTERLALRVTPLGVRCIG